MSIHDQGEPEPRTRSPQGGDEGFPDRGDWEYPDFYGEAEALSSMGTIAAPLLAGFSLAAMAQTVTIKVSDTRWPEAALLLFMLAAILFVATVQAMFWARRYQTSPREIKDWWPDSTDDQRMKREQRFHAAGFRMWSNRARVTYSAALLSLLAALTILAIPPESHAQLPFLRWLAAGLGITAFLAEVIWIIASFTEAKWLAWLLEPPRINVLCKVRSG